MASPSSYTRTLRVVVADDVAHVRAHVADLLGPLGHVRLVAEVETMPDLLRAVERLRPDVVVLDISMPGGSGIEALRHIRARHPRTEVIMLTNHADPFYRDWCLDAGARHFLDKCGEFEQLRDVLEQMERPA